MTRRPLEDWFTEPGAYVLVDGQYGSTGKGLMAGYIADLFASGYHPAFTHVTTNAGPNSGHTAYFRGEEKVYKGHGDYDIEQREEKIVTQQVPIAAVFAQRYGHSVPVIINAGAIIDPDILELEVIRHKIAVYIHPCAALIGASAKFADKATTSIIAGTGKGTGPALQAKIGRLNLENVATKKFMPVLPADRHSWDNFWDWGKDVVFVETAQGFSLGLNSARFYPRVTSRECTVMQAIADARIPAQMVRKVMSTFRTYPIRVGNTEGSSGDCYPDQVETTWENLGLKPEITTVTGRVRRVFTWSRTQFQESIAANRPDSLLLNFLNYIPAGGDERNDFCHMVWNDYLAVMKRPPEDFLLGYGPLSSDIKPIEVAMEEAVW